jgi:hypothetical protein
MKPTQNTSNPLGASVSRWFQRTPVHTFLVCPLIVIACELALHEPARRSALLNRSTRRDAVDAPEYERSCRARALPARIHLQKADLPTQRAEGPTRPAPGHTIDSPQWSARSRQFAQWSHSELQAIPGPVRRRAGAEHLQTSCLHPCHPSSRRWIPSPARLHAEGDHRSANIPCLQRLRYRDCRHRCPGGLSPGDRIGVLEFAIYRVGTFHRESDVQGARRKITARAANSVHGMGGRRICRAASGFRYGPDIPDHRHCRLLRAHQHGHVAARDSRRRILDPLGFVSKRLAR